MTIRLWQRQALVLSMALLSACASPAPSASPAPTAASAPGAPNASGAAPSAIAEVVAGAQREGTVNWAVTPDFVDGVDEIKNLVKSQYGVDLKVNASGQSNYPEKASKAISELQAGAPASYDLLDLSDSTVTPLLDNKAAKAVDWAQYLTEPTSDSVFAGVLLAVRDSFLAPAYNPTVIPADAAPKSYDDLIDPKWKGKISVIDAQSYWVWLAQPNQWGEQRLLDYMRKLYAQQPAVDRYGGMLSRLLSGEYPISSGLDSGSVWLAQRKGQPVATVPVSPMRDAKYGAVIPQNAAHPNAAILVALAEASPQGQAVLDRVTAQSAAWVKGTPSAKFAAENNVAQADPAFTAANQDRIVKEIAQIAKE